MSDMDPRLRRGLDDMYQRIEHAGAPAHLEEFDARGAQRRQRVLHTWAAIAGAVVVAAALSALVVGLAAHRSAPPAPATAPPALVSPHASPAASPSPSLHPSPAPDLSGFHPLSLTAISEKEWWVLGTGYPSGSTADAIIHTTDGGTTFSLVAPPPGIIGDVIRFADESDGWILGGGTLLATHDGGHTWHSVSGLRAAELEPGSNGLVYAVLCTGMPPGAPCTVRRAAVSGDAWQTLAVPSLSQNGAVISIGVHGTSLWVMDFGTGRLWVSHDTGNTFSADAFPCAQGLSGSLDPVSDSVLWTYCATGTQGAAFLSSDGGATFHATAMRGSNGAIVAAVSASTAFVADASAALQETTNSGATFSTVFAWQPASFWVGFTDASAGYAVLTQPNSTTTALWRTVDGGAHWTQVVF